MGHISSAHIACSGRSRTDAVIRNWKGLKIGCSVINHHCRSRTPSMNSGQQCLFISWTILKQQWRIKYFYNNARQVFFNWFSKITMAAEQSRAYKPFYVVLICPCFIWGSAGSHPPSVGYKNIFFSPLLLKRAYDRNVSMRPAVVW